MKVTLSQDALVERLIFSPKKVQNKIQRNISKAQSSCPIRSFAAASASHLSDTLSKIEEDHQDVFWVCHFELGSFLVKWMFCCEVALLFWQDPKFWRNKCNFVCGYASSLYFVGPWGLEGYLQYNINNIILRDGIIEELPLIKLCPSSSWNEQELKCWPNFQIEGPPNSSIWKCRRSKKQYLQSGLGPGKGELDVSECLRYIYGKRKYWPMLFIGLEFSPREMLNFISNRRLNSSNWKF